MKRLLTAAALLGVLLIPACSESAPESPSSGEVQASWDGQPSVDPYDATGVWQVPEDIAPGRYAVTPGSGSAVSLRWVSVCFTEWCDDGYSAEKSDGFAYAPEGGGQAYILVPADGSVKAVENMGVKLTRVE